MRMPGEDAQKILNRGKFLEERGFKATPDAYGVDYFDGNIRIMAYYERYEYNSGLDIKFPGNYHFQISWIALVREGIETRGLSPLEKILRLMEYLEENPQAFPRRGITYAQAKMPREKLEAERRR